MKNILVTKEIIVNFILNEVKESSTKGVVIGLSGGIDSTLVAHLAVEALGKDRVSGIYFQDSSFMIEDDKLEAEETARYLGIDFKIIEISEIVNSFISVIPDSNQSNNLIRGNLKARIRMAILYFYANLFNKMVIGTGNKTEILLGYYTKYGDGGVDIQPIGDLYKGDVKELSRFMKIPERIINKIPSARFWEGQTDEGDLGFSYETIDLILTNYKNKKELIDIQNRFGISDQKLNNLLSLISSNVHKRKIPPVPIIHHN